MKRISKMKWTDWNAHENSLFFVVGSKSWHANWSARTSDSGDPSATDSETSFIVDEEKLPSHVDLSLIINRSPWVIPPFFNLSMAYATFRSMGLRHMVVVDGETVKGIITRKDLLANTLRSKLDELHEALRGESDDHQSPESVSPAHSTIPQPNPKSCLQNSLMEFHESA